MINCSDYFEDFITEFGEIGPNESLVHLKSSTLNNAYIAKFDFDLDNDGIFEVNIFVELISEFINFW